MAVPVDPWIADELVALPKVGSDVPQTDSCTATQHTNSLDAVGMRSNPRRGDEAACLRLVLNSPDNSQKIVDAINVHVLLRH